MTLRCVIVDDSPLFLAAARGLLERQGFAVVGSAATGAEAMREVERLRPDVTLVDVDLGGESGFDVVRSLAERAGADGCPVILISTHAEEDFADLIAASPALGFLAKSALSGPAVQQLLSGTPET